MKVLIPKIRKLLWFLFVLAIPVIGFAQDDMGLSQNNERTFSETKYQQLKEKKEYQAFLNYRTPINKDESWLQVLFSKMIQFIFKNRVIKFLFTILPYLLIIGAFVLIVLRLSNVEISSLLKPNIKQQGYYVEYADENIHEIEIEKLLNQALKNGDYKLATRYNYLKTLKFLSDNDKIKWEIYKTNYEYQHELRKEVYSNIFSVLTRYFEYIWYGDFELEFVDYYSESVKLSNQIINSLNTK